MNDDEYRNRMNEYKRHQADFIGKMLAYVIGLGFFIYFLIQAINGNI
jgi:hypothetical protein